MTNSSITPYTGPMAPPFPRHLRFVENKFAFIVIACLFWALGGHIVFEWNVGTSGASDARSLAAIFRTLVFFGAFLVWGMLLHSEKKYWAKVDRAAHQLNEYRAWAIQQEEDAAQDEWEASRPLALVAASEHALDELDGQMETACGTALLGLQAETQELTVMPRNASAVVVGPSQCGKTTGIANPSICVALGAVLAVSTKQDVMLQTLAVRQFRGRCWIYDPTGSIPDSSIPAGVTRAYWSWLERARTWDEAIIAAESAVGATGLGKTETSSDQHWKDVSEQLLGPLFFAAAQHQDLTMSHILSWVQHRDFSTPISVLEIVASDASHLNALGAELALDALGSYVGQVDSKHQANVLASTETVLKAYRFERMRRDAGKRNFDIDRFVRSTDTLYIVSSEKVQRSSAPLIASLIDVTYDAVVALDREDPFQQSKRPPLLAAIDEAGNAAPSPRMSTFLSEGQGQGFQSMVFLQTLAQARKAWGELGKAILDSPVMKVAFGGISDHDTLEAFSVLVGDHDRAYTSSSTSWSASVSEGSSSSKTYGLQASSSTYGTNAGTSRTAGESSSINFKKERWLTPGDIATLPPGQALVIGAARWSKVDIVGTHHYPWQRVAQDGARAALEASRPTAGGASAVDVANSAEVPNLPFPLPQLASLAAIDRAAAPADRAAARPAARSIPKRPPRGRRCFPRE